MGRVRCIRPKTDVVSLGQKKASKKLIKKSKVNEADARPAYVA